MSEALLAEPRSDVIGGEVFKRGFYVWCLDRGRVRRAEVTGSTLRLPLQDSGHPDDWVEAVSIGIENAHFRRWTLPVLQEHAMRMAPWVRWWFAPTFVGCHGVLPGDGWGGMAHLRQDCILLRSCWDPRWTMEIAMHEIFHAIERYLTPAEMAAVNAAVEIGMGWPDPYGKDGYMSTSMQERRARAFEMWAMHRLEALSAARLGRLGRIRDALGRWGMPPHERVFLAVFEGRIARRVIRKRQVARERLPEKVARQGDEDRAALEAAPLGVRIAREVTEAFLPA